MSSTPLSFPAPDAQALALSENLCRRIRSEIEANGGAISFARYMEMALYEPGLGYYSAGLRKFGPDGDFVTAPEVSPLFARCVANTCTAVLESLGGGDIMEIGAGSGALAADLLSALQGNDSLPQRYLILETSADLCDRQRQWLTKHTPALLQRVQWLDAIPSESFDGVILANEVVDALPVQRFHWCDGQVFEWQVAWDDARFVWKPQPCTDTPLAEQAQALAECYAWAAPYTSELNINLAAWIAGVSAPLRKGLFMLTDYGYAGSEYYHPQRDNGTLMCHYRHRAHADPLILTGLQDITAHVDFSELAVAAETAGLHLSGYTTQAHFLIDTGIDALLAQANLPDQRAFLELTRQAKTLMMPGEMGERFKCMALTREVEVPLPGFRAYDLRRTL